VAFRVILYLAQKEISYEKEVKRLLDAPEESIKALKDRQETSDLDITEQEIHRKDNKELLFIRTRMLHLPDGIHLLEL